MRVLWAVLGSMALEGPVIEWVAYHRRHHRFSDAEGDPHSPHVGHGSGVLGALRGLFYAHVGWVLFSDEPAEEDRYAPDLIADPAVRFVDRTFVLWAVLGLAVPFGLGVALTGTISGGLLGLLWGGAACGSSSCTTSPSASTPSATSSGAATSRPATSRATWPGSRR